MDLHDLMPIQQLAGTGEPFDRLSNFLNRKVYGFAAIDAPFSLPHEWSNNPEALWHDVLALKTDDRPFGTGASLIASLAPNLAPRGRKILRDTELHWKRRGINVRSGLWNGPRGGAAFAVACMTLLARHKGPVWPYKMQGDGITLAEAFPAAQLVQWNLPHKKYDGPSTVARTNRAAILDALCSNHGLSLNSGHQVNCINSADALDAVICIYAAAALANDARDEFSGGYDSTEGIIAVHR